MAEYISKQDVIDYLSGYLNSLGECGADSLLFDRGQRRALINSIQDISAVKAADVQPVDRWISCKDKMPEEYKTVLVYEKDYGVMIGELEKKFFDTQYFIARKSGLILRTTEVTHWQPLPEPPKQ